MKTTDECKVYFKSFALLSVDIEAFNIVKEIPETDWFLLLQ